jgi:hypothetical protein
MDSFNGTVPGTPEVDRLTLRLHGMGTATVPAHGAFAWPGLPACAVPASYFFLSSRDAICRANFRWRTDGPHVATCYVLDVARAEGAT